MDKKKIAMITKYLEETDNAADSENTELKFITIKEACEILKFSRWTITRMLRMKDANGNYLIRWSKHGNANSSPVRIDKASFRAFLESKVQQAGKEKEVEK